MHQIQVIDNAEQDIALYQRDHRDDRTLEFGACRAPRQSRIARNIFVRRVINDRVLKCLMTNDEE